MPYDADQFDMVYYPLQQIMYKFKLLRKTTDFSSWEKYSIYGRQTNNTWNITFCSENPFESKGQEVKKMFIQSDFEQQW